MNKEKEIYVIENEISNQNKLFLELFDLFFLYKVINKKSWWRNTKFNLKNFQKLYSKKYKSFVELKYNYNINDLDEKIFLKIINDIFEKYEYELNDKNIDNKLKNYLINNINSFHELYKNYLKNYNSKSFQKILNQLYDFKININKINKKIFSKKQIISFSALILILFSSTTFMLNQNKKNIDNEKKLNSKIEISQVSEEEKSNKSELKNTEKKSQNLNKDLNYWTNEINNNLKIKTFKNKIYFKLNFNYDKSVQVSIHIYDTFDKEIKSYFINKNQNNFSYLIPIDKEIKRIIVVVGNWDIGFKDVFSYKNYLIDEYKKYLDSEKTKDLDVFTYNVQKNFINPRKSCSREEFYWVLENFRDFKTIDKAKILKKLYSNDYYHQDSFKIITKNMSMIEIGTEFINHLKFEEDLLNKDKYNTLHSKINKIQIFLDSFRNYFEEYSDTEEYKLIVDEFKQLFEN